MADIKCPMCGKPNPEDLDVCQFCEARLKPLTDALSRAQPPIHAGDEPKKKDTSELEPVLPQWLRDVRQQARDSFEDDQPDEDASGAEKEDLLAGLGAQAEEDGDVPDWLASLRGAEPQSTPQQSVEESAPASEEPAEQPALERPDEDLPDWLANLQSESAGTEEGSEDWLAGAPDTESASDPDRGWLADLEDDEAALAEPAHDTAPFDTELPDWLKGADEKTPDQADDGLSEWLQASEPFELDSGDDKEEIKLAETLDWSSSETEKPEKTSPEESQPFDDSEVPDWIAALGSEETQDREEEQLQPMGEDDLPEWLKTMRADEMESGDELQPTAEEMMPAWEDATEGESAVDEAPAQAQEDLPDWLGSVTQDDAPATDAEKPEWLSSMEGFEEGAGVEQEASLADETPEPAPESDLPDWISSLGQDAEAPVLGELEAPVSEAELPDWLTTGDAEEVGAPLPLEGEALQPAVPALVENDDVSLADGDVDELLSMDMPDWLTDTGVEQEKPTEELLAEEIDEEITPAELPSWVQAMRPVEAVISETPAVALEDQPLEEKGPLAGLRGVLPAVPGMAPTSKPKAYSLKLQASEEQQASALMLEQILASETNPKPLVSRPIMLSQRVLRWMIALVIIPLVGLLIFSGLNINPMPVGLQPETWAAVQVVQNLPEDARVLLVFDYEASLAGELEAAGVSLVDHMIILKHPRLALLASAPTGTGLADRFMSLHAEHRYQSGQNVINLGYLPGGAAGVAGFLQAPSAVMPYAVDGSKAWELPVLAGAGQLSDFDALILLTDNADSARVWIEQIETGQYLDGGSLLVVSSAQSAPMIQPYVQSGQVDGMVTGLDGGAGVEQVNNGRPGISRRYWDAYGIGLLAAVSMIALGSLWSLVTGLRTRSTKQGEE